ncbi:dTDP-4-dehydrorhamnose reductase family protein [Ectobacillus ponti]|uniref:dTDP-4-dehydrorhamnose reductase n=1 Tax=Ectobacillus ponti TaxID=2961894 RepID=A0AA41X3M7_9BACI|nr:SDR family oxidoreductase [Ectobacillus ponti]MCP8968339.1 SDR family oxidoreductase [Ectobacillus ponti]
MKVLILGGQGMAGHIIADYLQEQTDHEVWRTVRRETGDSRCLSLDVREETKVKGILEQIRPDVVINAVGLLNEAVDRHLADAIYVNSLLPHRLASWGEELSYRLIHISTDCVFSGRNGGYREQDAADADSLYGRTKYLGEVQQPHLTIRTSIIGPELKENGIGLFHWFMKQTGTIKGFTEVFWNGVTTLELAKFISSTIGQPLSGLIHLAAAPAISKHQLLSMMKEEFSRDDITIVLDAGPRSDKSIVSTRGDISYTVPAYRLMLQELHMWMQLHQEQYQQYNR